MWTFIKTYWKYILAFIILFAIMAGLYFEGKSAGKAIGYRDGYEKCLNEYKTKLDCANTKIESITSAYNDFIKANNAKVKELEERSIQLTKDKKALLSKYDALMKEQKMSTKNASIQAWTEETVTLINNLL